MATTLTAMGMAVTTEGRDTPMAAAIIDSLDQALNLAGLPQGRELMPDSTSTFSATTQATLGSAVPILRVASLHASLAYYTDRLGFELQWRSDPLASVKRDRTSLMLSEGDQGQSGTWLWISTSDVDALYAELETRGALLRHPPTNYPWGSRECQVSDPDGHVLRFGAESNPDAPLGAWLDGSGRRWLPQPDGSWRESI